MISIGVFSCAPNDVIVANIPDDDGGKPSPPPPCVNDGDCESGQFCERDACADQVGHCRDQPPFCDNSSDAKCGCDGVTYWNDCLRAQNAVSKDVDGTCPNGAACGGPAQTKCANTNAVCGALFFHQDQCMQNPPGQCWVLSDTCPTDPDTDWVSCNAPSCTDVCTAIRSGAQYFHADTSACP
jgi:hypothetical protein